MRQDRRVWGLNTTATLWCSAAFETLSGIGLIAEAVVVTLAVLAGNRLLRPLVNAINCAPVDELASEASYEVYVLMNPKHVGAVRDQIGRIARKANHRVRGVEVLGRSGTITELTATLVSTAVDPGELDAMTTSLDASPLVSHATSSSSADE